MFGVLSVPDFALEAILALESDLRDRPVALMERVGQKSRIRQRNERARTCGVDPGMTAGQAKARCEDLIFRERSQSAEDLAGKALFLNAYTLSPLVEKTAEGLCTVDVSAAPPVSLRESGDKLVRNLHRQGYSARLGLARTPDLAAFAARCAEPLYVVEDEASFLDQLPVEFADPPDRILDVLDQWGIATMGELTALSRIEISRLGAEGVHLWDRAGGWKSRLLATTSLPREFKEQHEFELPLERLDPLLFILRRLLDQMAFQLEISFKVAKGMALRLDLEGGGIHRRKFGVPEPTRDPELLLRMLFTHLEGLRTDQPVKGVGLMLYPREQQERQRGLFEAQVRDPRRLSETVSRLMALVGQQRSGRALLENSHRPESFRLEPFGEPQSDGLEATSLPEVRGLQLRRFRPALSVAVATEKNYGEPQMLRAKLIRGRVVDCSGPWVLSGHWWDQGRWSREEWDVELADGGLYRLASIHGSWFLEGEYD